MTEAQTQRQLVRDLLDRAFGGSASKLVMQALAARRATPEELSEIRRLLDDAQPRGRRGRRPADVDAARMTMSMIDLLVQQPVAQAIGWALLQFVWQGAVLGVMTALLLAALRRSAADVRYVVATIASR